MFKPLLALAAAATLMTAGSAQAGNLSWSVGIDGPQVGAVISGGPGYGPVPYDEPHWRYMPRQYVRPVAVYKHVPVYAEPPVVYVPYGVYPRPLPVLRHYRQHNRYDRYQRHDWHDRYDKHERHDDRHDRHDRHDEHRYNGRHGPR